MFTRVRLITRDAQDAMVLPEQALVPQGDQQFVYRIIDGKAVRTRVELGQRRDAMVEILNGVAKGDLVVTAGQLKLRDGAPVSVAGAASAKDSSTAVTPPMGPGGGGTAVIAPANAAPGKADTVQPTPAPKS
jgi:membrane fusion protein, multidrug efflux system